MAVQRKPHCNVEGYVAERKCRLGGYLVIYDARRATWVDASARWVVVHEPSGHHVCVRSLVTARAIMRDVAEAASPELAGRVADFGFK